MINPQAPRVKPGFCEKLAVRWPDRGDFGAKRLIAKIVPLKTGLHEYLDRTQGRLIEISTAMIKQYCEWLDPDAVAQVGAQDMA